MPTSERRGLDQLDGRVESEPVAVVFGAGLLAVCGLFYFSLVGVTGPVGMGFLVGLVGLVELVLAWRVTAPPGAQVLRWVAAVLGLFTIAWAVVRILVS